MVAAALLFRGMAVSPSEVWARLDVVANLLAGSLIGAWWAAGHAIALPRHWLNRIVMALLVGLSLVMLAEAWAGGYADLTPLFEPGPPRSSPGWWPGSALASWPRCWAWPVANC